MGLEDLYARFVGADYDAFDNVGPKRKLIICTTPRTGGHFVCQRLKERGLGVPTEYFQWQYALPLMRRWSKRDDLDLDALRLQARAYGHLLLANRSRNGIFSAKIFPENLRFMRDALGDDDDTWMYLHVARRDKIEQTISLLAMTCTGRPFDSDDQMFGVSRLNAVGENSVRNTVQYIHDSESAWARALAIASEERKATIDFEDLAMDLPDTLAMLVRDFSSSVANAVPVTGRRYKTDVDLKNQIRARYGDYISDLWSALPTTGI